MDYTIISVKSGAKFPKNRSDWEWWDESVPAKLKELHQDNYKIVIFTNQAGIEKKKQKPGDLQGKIFDMCKELGFPVQCFMATATDIHRKPNTMMWDILKTKYNADVEIDLQKSVYVGDAAGRKKDWKKGAGKDHSCDDRKANNCSIK